MRLLLLILIASLPSSGFSSELLTMVRDPQTYEFVLETLNNPVVRTTIAEAAVVLPQAAAAVGVTVSAGVTLPLAAAVLGSAWLSQDLYNKQQIKREWYNQPQYAEMSPVASAQDFICQPAHITVPINTVTPESFPIATEQLIGRPCVLSSPVGDFIKTAQDSSNPLVQSLKDLITGSTPTISNPRLEDSSSTLPVGTILITTGGIKWIINGPPSRTSFNYLDVLVDSYMMGISGTQQIQGFRAWKLGNQNNVYSPSSRLAGYRSYGTYKGYPEYYHDVYPVVPASTGEPILPPTAPMDFTALKAALKTYFQGNPDAVQEVFKEIDPKNIAVTDKVPSTSDPVPRQQTGPISQDEVNNFLTNNSTNVTNYNTTNITESTTSNQIAQYEAATKAAQQAARNLPSSATVTGSAALPDLVEYNSTVAEVVEVSFVDRVHAFLNSGLPVLASIKSSGLTASGSPTMSCTLWGHLIQVDFSGQQGVLRSAGILLVSLSTLFSFMIVVRS